MNKFVWRLLRRNISVAQVFTYFIALLCGITLVMLAVRFKHDASAWLNPDSNIPQEYFTISKTVDRSGFGDNSFTNKEIAKLCSQQWVDTVAPYLSGDFSVVLSMNLGMSISTSMFLESVPDCFLDTIPDNWGYTPGSSTVPLIIPRDYLTLYNYGFASTRSLPSLSESTLQRLPIILTVSGNGKSAQFQGQIAGFSSRINSVLAPEEFIQLANSEFGTSGTVQPTRLLVRSNADTDKVNSYLRENNLERSGEGVDTSLLSSVITLLTSLLIAIGTIIILLSFIIQLLSLYLLIEKNRSITARLIFIGYAPSSIKRYYLIFISVTNIITFIIASVLTPLLATLWQQAIPAQSFTIAPYLSGAAIILLLTLPVIPLLRRI